MLLNVHAVQYVTWKKCANVMLVRFFLAASISEEKCLEAESEVTDAKGFEWSKVE